MIPFRNQEWNRFIKRSIESIISCESLNLLLMLSKDAEGIDSFSHES